VRASSYGMAPDYVATCADNLLIACQIESFTAVNNIDAILAVDGIDLMFIGPFDLSATVGRWATSSIRRSPRCIERAERAIRAAGRPMGTVPHPGCTALDMFDRGYQFVNAGSDVRACATARSPT
jgi:4-hydroxy-2-oxoheptanedioate aldolase